MEQSSVSLLWPNEAARLAGTDKAHLPNISEKVCEELGLSDLLPLSGGLTDYFTADPDVILISDYGDGTAAEQFCALPGYGELRAVQEGHVYALTDDLISRPGPRIVEALKLIAELLHPAN